MKSATMLIAATLATGVVLTGCGKDSAADAKGTSGSSSSSASEPGRGSDGLATEGYPTEEPQGGATTGSAKASGTTLPKQADPKVTAKGDWKASGSPSQAPAKPGCGSANAREARQNNIEKVPAPPAGEWSYSDSVGLEGYDPCADLSYVILDVEGGTASSPRQMMLFNKGEYLGTASEKPFQFSADVKRQGPGVITVTYKYAKPGDANANPSGRAVSTFTWNAAQKKVVHTGEFPPGIQ